MGYCVIVIIDRIECAPKHEFSLALMMHVCCIVVRIFVVHDVCSIGSKLAVSQVVV